MNAPEPEAKIIEFQELELSKLVFPIARAGDYQRDLVERRVQEIVSHFNPLRLGTPEAAFYDGHFWCWDGQHRIMALRKMGRRTVWCRVAYGYSMQECADAFADQGENRSRVPAKDTWRAKLAADSPTYRTALTVLSRYDFGLNIQRGGGHRQTPGIWRCHGAVLGALRLSGAYGIADLEMACRVLRESWGDTAPSGTMFSGLAEFIRAYARVAPSPAKEKDYFAQTLIAILRGHDEDFFIRGARSSSRPGKMLSKVRWVLFDLYNSRRTYQLPKDRAEA